MLWRLLAEAEAAGLWVRLKLWVEGLAASPAAAWSLFLLAFAESSFFPIPPDVLLMAVCLSEAALESFALTMWFAAVCTVGSTLGGGFGYVLGLKAGRPILKRLIRQERIDAAERLLQKYDVWAVAAAGFTPIPYKVFTICSGLLRVRFVRFLIASVLSRGGRFFLVAVLCHLLGPTVRSILDRYFGWATLAFFALLFGGFYVVAWVARRAEPAASPGARDEDESHKDTQDGQDANAVDRPVNPDHPC